MANEIRTGIKLTGDASGAKAALEQVGQGAEHAGSALDKAAKGGRELDGQIKSLIATVAGWQVAAKFVETADAMTNMQSRLKLVTSTTGELTHVQARQGATERHHAWLEARNLELAERLKPGYQRMLEAWADTTRQMRDTYDKAMQSALRAGEDEFARSSGNLQASAAAMSHAIEQEILRMVSRLSMASLQSGLGGMFGGGNGGFGTGNSYGNQDLGAFLHGGGMVGSEATFRRAVSPAVFRGAPRFHTGGLAGDEVPIIARRGEGVFTPGQMKALGAGLGGGGVQVKVNVINNTDANVSARRSPDGSEIEILIDRVDAGLADRASTGQSRLGQALAARHGMQEVVI